MLDNSLSEWLALVHCSQVFAAVDEGKPVAESGFKIFGRGTEWIDEGELASSNVDVEKHPMSVSVDWPEDKLTLAQLQLSELAHTSKRKTCSILRGKNVMAFARHFMQVFLDDCASQHLFARHENSFLNALFLRLDKRFIINI